jgi:transcriptional regulator with XRE-family HTH domain
VAGKEWPPAEEFADRFARLRRHKGLDNAEIAEATGVIPKTVSMWAGGQVPKGAPLLALARLFEVSPDYLLTGQEPHRFPVESEDTTGKGESATGATQRKGRKRR